ncbi:hypothetical protein EV126DRAFT_428801 [Verticillium dahliae]|nr:hypothetical protein EV126DRAFT_428801 [Verticillium dahliae]
MTARFVFVFVFLFCRLFFNARHRHQGLRASSEEWGPLASPRSSHHLMLTRGAWRNLAAGRRSKDRQSAVACRAAQDPRCRSLRSQS